MSQQPESSPPSTPVPSQASPVAKGKGRATSPSSTPVLSRIAREALAKATDQTSQEKLDSVKRKATGLKTAIQELKAEADALEHQDKERARKRIEEDNKWTEELDKILESSDRKRKVNETVDLLHRLARAKHRGDDGAIKEVEDEIAEVDWDILEAGIAKADEIAARVRARWAVTADKGRAQPEKSQCSEGSGI